MSAEERASKALTAAESAAARFAVEEPKLIKATADAFETQELKAAALALAAPDEWAAYVKALEVIANRGGEEAAQRAFYAAERTVERAAPVKWAEYLTAIAAYEQAKERQQTAYERAEEAASGRALAQEVWRRLRRSGRRRKELRNWRKLNGMRRRR